VKAAAPCHYPGVAKADDTTTFEAGKVGAPQGNGSASDNRAYLDLPTFFL